MQKQNKPGSGSIILRGICPKPKFNMFCALSQNYQHFVRFVEKKIGINK